MRANGKRSKPEMEVSRCRRGREGGELTFAPEELIRELLARGGVKSDPSAYAIWGLMHEAVDCWMERLKRERLRFGGVFSPTEVFRVEKEKQLPGRP